MKALFAFIPAIAIGLASCSTALLPAPVDTPEQPSASAMPKAIVYLTNGDYADNVPVSLNASGTALASYPDPRDITSASRPVKLAGGWLLDCRGVTSTSVFLDYTYKEYAALPSCPSPDELMKHIIPGSRVTEIRQLPIYHQQAVKSPAEASKLVEKAHVVYRVHD